MLGELAVTCGGAPVDLPPSKKTRALLAYLALTRRPHRRERLCEIFWEVPDDPRGSLRWSLSKLRQVLNLDGRERLTADRERVTVEDDGVAVDILELRQQAEAGALAPEVLAVLAEALRPPLLDGLDLPQQEPFQAWLTAEREEARRTRRAVISRLAADPGQPPGAALRWAREWVELDGLSAVATGALVRALRRLGRADEAEAAERRYRTDAAAAGLAPQALNGAAAPRQAPTPVTGRQLLQRQKVGFCQARDGARIAYGVVGEGPPLVKAANWLNHLELDWDSPVWAPLFRELARDHRFVRYDERGNGLSDWNVADLSFEAFVDDLEAVVEETGLERFPLLGISQGCAVAIAYAVRHPERVSHLILWGGYAAGWRIDASPEVRAEREAVITLVRHGWGRDDHAYRQIFSSTFMPSANLDELAWFNAFQRRTTSAENAARFLEAFADIDVRHLLARVQAPTLVMHAKNDRRIPVSAAGALAAGIPGAELVTLDSDGHLLLGREPASEVFVAHVRDFIGCG